MSRKPGKPSGKKAAPVNEPISDRLTYRELRNTPGRVWERLSTDEPLTLIADGVAKAVVIPLNGDDAETVRSVYRQARAMLALRRLQAEARKKGTDKMTLEEINAVIREVREERKREEECES